MYKISIIESQPIIREGLRVLLSKQLGFNVLRSYSDFFGFLQDAEAIQPDVVILDLNLCHINEIDAIDKIRRQFLNIKILVFSTNHHEECIKCAFRAGAHGYIHKETTPQQLCDAVKGVVDGRYYLSEMILPIVINSFMCSETKQADSVIGVNLTTRESELLKLISAGYKNKEIANTLCLSIKTIEAHRSNLMKKLNVHNVAGLTTKASQLGVNHY